MTSSAAGAELAPTKARPARELTRWELGLIGGLCLLAALHFSWPAYRTSLHIELDYNEGWNAYFADAAMGAMPLYPAQDQLMTNNYPPLSFYVVGLAGRLIHDPVLAGRLLSLAAVLTIAALVGIAIRRLGSSVGGAVIGAATYVATMSCYFGRYVGMNDPQLLGQAVMTLGLVWLLISTDRGRRQWVAFLIMVVAGFMKHNLIAMPATALLWLLYRDPRVGMRCGLVCMGALAAGFLACFALFGHDFFANLMSPRQASWEIGLKIRPLLGRAGPFVIWLCLIWMGWAILRWADRAVWLCSLLVVLAATAFLLQIRGEGVDVNSIFELVTALSITTGLAFASISSLLAPRSPAYFAIRALLLVSLIVAFFPLHQRKVLQLIFEPEFDRQLAFRTASMAEDVARVRDTPGEVLNNSPLVCYWAGKPSFVDGFNVDQRITAGLLPKQIIENRLRDGTLTFVPRSE